MTLMMQYSFLNTDGMERTDFHEFSSFFSVCRMNMCRIGHAVMAFYNDVHAGMNAVAGDLHRLRRFDADFDLVNDAHRISGGFDDRVHAGLIVTQNRFVRYEQSILMITDDDFRAAKHLEAELGSGCLKAQPHFGHLCRRIDLWLYIFDLTVKGFFRPGWKTHRGFLS